MSDPNTTDVTITLDINDLVTKYLQGGRWSETDEAWIVRGFDYLLDPHKQIIQITAKVDKPSNHEKHHHD